MNCVITLAQGKDILILNNLSDANGVADILNADCAVCGICERWDAPTPVGDGRYWLFSNPNCAGINPGCGIPYATGSFDDIDTGVEDG